MTTALVSGVFQSKWGFHPCDYATYRKLKRLNWFAQLARRLDAEHDRWDRKQPQNRFLKTRVRDGERTIKGWAYDANGNRIPWPEPQYLRGQAWINSVEENCHRARYPKPSPDEVKPLSIQDIDQQLADLENWYQKHKSEIR
jgi:hypothetical protein